jgi:hypothetical protein
MNVKNELNREIPTREELMEGPRLTIETYRKESSKSLWRSCKSVLPEENKWVVLWKYNQRRYTIAKIEFSREDNPMGLNKLSNFSKRWRSSRGSQVKIDERDHWISFPYLELTEIYE